MVSWIKSGIVTTKCTIYQKNGDRTYKFNNELCSKYPLSNQCLNEKELQKNNGRPIKISTRYDAVIHDMNRVPTDRFKDALNKRYKVENRFATLVRNNWLRHS